MTARRCDICDEPLTGDRDGARNVHARADGCIYALMLARAEATLVANMMVSMVLDGLNEKDHIRAYKLAREWRRSRTARRADREGGETDG